jgi:hypothetical protein
LAALTAAAAAGGLALFLAAVFFLAGACGVESAAELEIWSKPTRTSGIRTGKTFIG